MAPIRITELSQNVYSGSQDIYDGAGYELVNLVDNITQDTKDSGRIGDRIELRSIHIQGYVYNHIGVTTNTLTNYRIWVFQYFSDNNVAQPDPSLMLIASSANAGATYGTWSVENIDRIRQYRVLYRSPVMTTVGSYSLAVTGAAGGGDVLRSFEFDVPLANADRNITFFGAAVTGMNHIYMFITTDQATIAINPTVFYTIGVRYLG
jgi:hypothetical protein